VFVRVWWPRFRAARPRSRASEPGSRACETLGGASAGTCASEPRGRAAAGGRAVNSASEYPMDSVIDIGCTQNSVVSARPTRSLYRRVPRAQRSTAAAAPDSQDTVIAAVP
jgi:hypothetical protein